MLPLPAPGENYPKETLDPRECICSLKTYTIACVKIPRNVTPQ